jgi:hypothetical protein
MSRAELIHARSLGCIVATHELAEVRRPAASCAPDGRAFRGDDAWQLAVAERANARVVGGDRKAFRLLGSRYEEF